MIIQAHFQIVKILGEKIIHLYQLVVLRLLWRNVSTQVMVNNITHMNDCLRKNGHLTLLVSVLTKWKHNGMCFLDILICIISMGSVLYLFGCM